MSAEDEGRTEYSARAAQRAWDEGEVPLGRDVAPVAGLIAGAAALVVFGDVILTALLHTMETTMRAIGSTPFRILPYLILAPAAGAAVICAAAGLGSALAVLIQTRGGIWPERWLPDLTRVFNFQRVTQIFKKNLLVDLGLAVVKVLAVSGAAWTAVPGDFLTLPALLSAGPAEQISRCFGILLDVGWRMLLVASLIAGADLAVVHRRYRKQMLVTKQEAAREAKDDMGDPLIRGKRKQRHREISRGRARVEVPRADALLVNPTHVAIALRYRRDEGRAPRVTAKGKGVLAEYMRELAREHTIPIVEDVPLARLLYRKVKVGREVPASTYKAVAAVLAFVYRVTGRTAGRAST